MRILATLRIALFAIAILVPNRMAATSEQSRKALLVGIGHYPQGSGWSDISSTEDVNMLERTLSNSFSIIKIQDEQATLNGIKVAFDKLKSIINPGDTIIIHFSCHGQQMVTNDSYESDSLDEALIPYDALSRETPEYHGEKHLRDNEFGRLTQTILTATGYKGLLIVTLDACHSGDPIRGTKPSTTYRGSKDIFGLDKYDLDRQDDILQHRYDAPVMMPLNCKENFISISACHSSQFNYECISESGVHYGSLSLALSESFQQNGLSNIRLFVDSIKAKINRFSNQRQDPEIFPKEYDNYDAISETINHNQPITAASREDNLLFYLVIGALLVALTIIFYGRKKQ